MVAPAAGVQPWLVADEGDGAGGSHCHAIRSDYAAGVGVQATGHVNGEHGTRERVQLFDDGTVCALQGARKADAEQAVNDERPA